MIPLRGERSPCQGRGRSGVSAGIIVISQRGPASSRKRVVGACAGSLIDRVTSCLSGSSLCPGLVPVAVPYAQLIGHPGHNGGCPYAGPLAAQARSRRVAPDVPLMRRQMNAGQLPAARLVPRAAGARCRSTRLYPSRLHMAGSCHTSTKVQWKSDRGRRLRTARSATPCRFRTRQTCSDGKRLAHSAATVP